MSVIFNLVLKYFENNPAKLEQLLEAGIDYLISKINAAKK